MLLTLRKLQSKAAGVRMIGKSNRFSGKRSRSKSKSSPQGECGSRQRRIRLSLPQHCSTSSNRGWSSGSCSPKNPKLHAAARIVGSRASRKDWIWWGVLDSAWPVCSDVGIFSFWSPCARFPCQELVRIRYHGTAVLQYASFRRWLCTVIQTFTTRT